MNKTKILMCVAAVSAMFVLSGCDDDEVRQPQQTQYAPAPQQQMVDEQYVNQSAPQVVQAAPAPVIVQNSGSHDSGIGTFATGMMLGHMMSNSGGNNNGGGYSNNSSRTTIINNNTVSQPRSSYSSSSHSFYDAKGKQVYQSQPRSTRTQTYSRPTINTNSSYTTKKSYSSPLSSSRSYSSSSSRKSYSSSRRR
jgi:hypothetical protein|nr:MAG TPA: hypothetical protein [Caudoviricetes sp.]